MKLFDRFELNQIRGQLCAGVFVPGQGMPTFTVWSANKIQYAAADALGRMLQGDTSAVPAGMYIEFTNDVSWTAPADPGREASAYYHDTIPDTRDFLRVPFIVHASVSASSAVYESNVVDFLAVTSTPDSGKGVNDKLTFTRGTSKVVGGGVVAVPDWSDPDQDLIITRGYFASDGTLTWPVSAPGEIMMRWQITLG